MPAAWVGWWRILSCTEDSYSSAVYDPRGHHITTIVVNVDEKKSPSLKPSTSPCDTTDNNSHYHASSKIKVQPHEASNAPMRKRKNVGSPALACCKDFKNIVHGNTRVVHRGDQESPRSHHSSSPNQLKELLHEPSILLSSPRTEMRKPSQLPRKPGSCYSCSAVSCEISDIVSPTSFHVFQSKQNRSGCSPPTCNKCGESVANAPDALEEHHAIRHSVTELMEGDSARSIVEIIFRSSWLHQTMAYRKPERVFKVHNSSKTITKFEEYRDMVKARAAKISKRQSRCLVDGNELLRFYSTTVACDMGKTCSSMPSCSPLTPSLCALESCGVCQILRQGFATKGQPGIYTNASSSQAHKYSMFMKGNAEYTGRSTSHAMLVCRVIAGRVRKSGYESSQEGSSNGYDSVAGEPGLYTDLDELLVLSNRAVLPCFIVVYSV
ncbi:hypothetical protein KP509_17G019700 [Ceratopteris richardii]|uniref:C2H2-type domain-containing protein n=1 Tax=Ceratopteris richardii TaxID=49495 RepID=A0A8T2STB8_CERRI|nr:hypothetical protein KP509_17G019700 [Ceratopteris richardii]